MSLIGLIYIHGMLDNIIFYRGPWHRQLLWYYSMYEIYDSLGRKYLSAFYKETASRGADLLQALFARQKLKVLSGVNHP